MSVSVLDNILNQTVVAVAGLGLALNGVVVPVVKRKLPKKEEQVDPATMITVSGAQRLDKVTRFAWPNTVKVDYDIEITVVSPNNDDQSANLPLYTQWRQQIRTLFGTPAVFAAPVWQTKIVDGPFLDRSELAANYDYQEIGVKVTTTEPGS